ncbi:site-specific recombinase [Bradyrhizobiaceae bacterium SG-6C]|nr:site-specific recombinase [Bradyrhizobiaceae bacterium SG-6C]
MKPKAYSYLRMSTDLQLKGDSRRRQLEASKAYAEAESLDLADDAQLEDIGISAFKGANVRDGALGQFLKAVEAGSVPRGSYLLVESLDRLSREEILQAQSVFLNIIQSGINLVTLIDGKVYRAENTNVMDLIMSLLIMERAHEESKTKSKRVGAAWKNKRAKAAADGQPMTARCPSWLKMSGDRKSYEEIPERVEIVRRIFADSVAGIGMYSIATRLNKEGIPAFVGKNGWHQSYVDKTLQNRAVLGEFQPNVKVDGKRVLSGEPIIGYYPSIISEDEFYRAQHARAARRVGGKGRKGRGYTNLFTGLARCAYCLATIVFENKGSGTKGGTYLVCGKAQRGLGCSGTRWRYRDFEASFLAFVQELDIESIVRSGEDASKRKSLENELTSLRGELDSVFDLMEKSFNLLAENAPAEFVAKKLTELGSRRDQLTERLLAKATEQEQFLTHEARFYSSKDEIRDLVKHLQMPASDELYKIRAQIASRLKALVHTLLIAPQGQLPIRLRNIEQMKSLFPDESDVISYMEQLASDQDDTRRYFVAGFQNNASRAVFPKYGDPLQYEEQIVGSKDRGVEIQRPEPPK